MGNLSFVLVCVSLVSGCSSLGEGIHEEESQGEEGVSYEFDSTALSMPKLYTLASKHCEQYGRVAVNQEPISHGVTDTNSISFRCLSDAQIRESMN